MSKSIAGKWTMKEYYEDDGSITYEFMDRSSNTEMLEKKADLAYKKTHEAGSKLDRAMCGFFHASVFKAKQEESYKQAKKQLEEALELLKGLT